MYRYLCSKRNLAKISQTELAKMLNIHQSAYSMKENGKTAFSIEEAIKVYKYINSKLIDEDKIPFEKMFKK